MGSGVILPTPGQPRTGADPTFKTASIPNAVSFAFSGIAPPQSLYVQRDDQLTVTAISSIAGEVVTFNIRFLRLEIPLGGQPDTKPAAIPSSGTPVQGTIITITQQVQLPIARLLTSVNFAVGEGFVLSVGAVAAQAATRGRTFARVSTFRGAIAAPQNTQTFMSDYVTNSFASAWPGGTLRHSTEGPGFVHSINQPNPAAGADWTFTSPSNSRARLDSFNAVFTASAAAANRQIQLAVDDGANTVWADDVAANVTASQVVNVAATQTNVPIGIVLTTLHCVFPPGLILPAGWRVRTNTAAIQAGDQWSAIWLNVEDWVDF